MTSKNKEQYGRFELNCIRRQWQTTPVLLPGKSHGLSNLVGCSPWGRWGSDMTERLHFHFPALEKEMATHSSVLAWRIPGTGEPGGLLFMGSHRVRHDWSDLALAELSKHSIYWFIWLHQVLLTACGIFVASCRMFRYWASGSLVMTRRLSTCGAWAPEILDFSSWSTNGLSCSAACGTIPWPGIEPVSLAL